MRKADLCQEDDPDDKLLDSFRGIHETVRCRHFAIPNWFGCRAMSMQLSARRHAQKKGFHGTSGVELL